MNTIPTLKERAAATQRAMDGAQAAPLPGPAREAFAGRPVTLGALVLRPVYLGDIDLLQQIGNPFAGLAETIVNPALPAPELTFAALREVVYLFSIPPALAATWQEEIDTKGDTAAESFRQAARLGTRGLRFSPPELIAAIRENITRGFDTALSVGNPDPKGAGPGNAPSTASAGASTCDAASPPSATPPRSA
jgi:hypothetical protein